MEQEKSNKQRKKNTIRTTKDALFVYIFNSEIYGWPIDSKTSYYNESFSSIKRRHQMATNDKSSDFVTLFSPDGLSVYLLNESPSICVKLCLSGLNCVHQIVNL